MASKEKCLGREAWLTECIVLFSPAWVPCTVNCTECPLEGEMLGNTARFLARISRMSGTSVPLRADLLFVLLAKLMLSLGALAGDGRNELGWKEVGVSMAPDTLLTLRP